MTIDVEFRRFVEGCPYKADCVANGVVIPDECPDCEQIEPKGQVTPCVAPLVIPPEALDLIRFLCATWAKIDQWASANADGDALHRYPVIQGTRNQFNLQRIGEQPYDTTNIHKAVAWMLENNG